MDITFPTTSSAIIQLEEGNYNLLQLVKQVDIAVKSREDLDPVDAQSEIGASEKRSKPAHIPSEISVVVMRRRERTLLIKLRRR